MDKKRKTSSSEFRAFKRIKTTTTTTKTAPAPQITTKFFKPDEVNDTLTALNYFRHLFPSDVFNLPKIVFINQVYSLLKNRTSVDRDIEALKLENKIILFKCDSRTFEENEVCICFSEDFKDYIQKLQSTASDKCLSYDNNKVSDLLCLFVDKIVPEANSLSLNKAVLIAKYKLNEKDLTYLIQFGLLTIKDAANFWVAIPNFGIFRRVQVETRKSIVDVIKKKKYKEISFEELNCKNSKKVKQIGVLYVLHDLLGDESIRIMELPSSGVFFKLNE